jgi:hypothetical protein
VKSAAGVALPLDAVQRRANGPAAIAACCALRIFDAATICIALVICAVPRIDVMRRRRSRASSHAHCQVRLN